MLGGPDEELAADDGMVYSANRLNPSKFMINENGQKIKKRRNEKESNGLFGDSDEENSKFSDSDSDDMDMMFSSPNPLRNQTHLQNSMSKSRDLGEMNSLDSTLDTLEHTFSNQNLAGNGGKKQFSEDSLKSLSKRLAKLETQMHQKAKQLEQEIKHNESLVSDKPQYSRENMMERMKQEQEEDLIGLSEVKKQQMKLLAGQRVTRKGKKSKKSKKKRKK